MTPPKQPPTAATGPAKLSDLSNQLSQLAQIATNAKTTFLGIALGCAYSFLTLFTTTDADLLSDFQFNVGVEVIPVNSDPIATVQIAKVPAIALNIELAVLP